MSSIEVNAFIFAILGFAMGLYAVIEVKAMQRSTHKVQIFNPINQEFTSLTDDEKKILSKDTFDNL